jgi:hypothetical protein
MKRSNTGVSRREIAAALAFATPALAQQSPAPSDNVDTVAREQLERNRNQLRKIKVPIGTEPSFAFRP